MPNKMTDSAVLILVQFKTSLDFNGNLFPRITSLNFAGLAIKEFSSNDLRISLMLVFRSFKILSKVKPHKKL